MLATANLTLHKIVPNSVAVIEAFPSDEYAPDLKDLVLGTDTPPLTVNSLYDPLGFAAPVAIHGRLLLRELSSLTEDWDAELPPSSEWEIWRNSLPALKEIQIPRTYTSNTLSNGCRKELCVFSDASTKAIAAVAYLKLTPVRAGTTSDSSLERRNSLRNASRLSRDWNYAGPFLPLNWPILFSANWTLTSTPQAATLTARSFSATYTMSSGDSTYMWPTESNASGSQPEQWNYVFSEQNPADIATRMVPADRLAKTAWLTGPEFLSRTDVASAEKEHQGFALMSPEADAEIRPVVTSLATNVST
ncbi:uncharacterized protein LOC135387556 [Ornithodoros turicata]|uniref:uncharacterized protein LOC135387556 n=1 Tax=Ornithodoros turicata TaxID=34597 RepID=UPI003138BC73